MVDNPRFVHINLVARDWRKLAQFYEQVFGCAIVPPERDLSGRWLEDVTAVAGARIRGAHLKLPGAGDDGPTLEIFQYEQQLDRQEPASNRPGFSHVAFSVADVEAARDEVLSAGGRQLGKLISNTYPDIGTLTVVYVTDPEGNIIELQKWTR